ncbi:hypothetical protein HUU40_29830 [candidate division KSB1 bacterium]|nr:hypothetical protein [candidate division KSB1 bacterium]
MSLVLPVAASGVKLAIDDNAYKAIAEQLDFGKDVIDASLEAGEKAGDWLGGKDDTTLDESVKAGGRPTRKDAVTSEYGEAMSAHGATLRELHALLKAKDPGFGGLVRAMNKRQEFLWVHPQFEGEY